MARIVALGAGFAGHTAAPDLDNLRAVDRSKRS